MAITSSILFIIYLALLIYIGWRQSKKINSMESYWMTDRDLPGWRIAFTLAASWFGLSSFTGQAGWDLRRRSGRFVVLRNTEFCRYRFSRLGFREKGQKDPGPFPAGIY